MAKRVKGYQSPSIPPGEANTGNKRSMGGINYYEIPFHLSILWEQIDFSRNRNSWHSQQGISVTE